MSFSPRGRQKAKGLPPPRASFGETVEKGEEVMAYATPPALSGWPLLGNLLEYRRDHVNVFWRAYKALGPIFSIRLGPQRAVVLIGPENHRFFYSQIDRILSLPEVYKFVVPMFGPVLNAAKEEDVRKKQLALLQSAFQGNKMRGHVRVMARETSAWLDTLGDEGTFELYESFAALGMNIAASAFMGQEIRRRMAEFLPLFEDLARGMEFVLPPNLPLPRFRRRDRAKQKLMEMIRPVIAEHQAHPERYDDFLQTITEGKYLESNQKADETIVGLALMTVFTAYITTAAQTCWSLVHLLQHPDYLAAVLDEQEEVLGDSPANVNAESLNLLEKLEWSLKESQRLQPVMSHYARYNTQAYELGGYRIPRGWLTMICPAVSHRLPEVFSQPGTFDPYRFSPERAEDRKHPYSLIGFSAGVYRCPGAGFGTNEMKCILSMLLQRYTLELVNPHPRRDYEMGVIRPQPPCLVQYRRRKVNRGVSGRSAVIKDATQQGMLCPAHQGAGLMAHAEPAARHE
jgi:sterol 14-demethylase